jgi:hypothetical protein
VFQTLEKMGRDETFTGTWRHNKVGNLNSFAAFLMEVDDRFGQYIKFSSTTGLFSSPGRFSLPSSAQR